ncbi:hypothetical protein Ga0080559_TMP721 [Salipiger profundus]|uniref:Uncharacterized protein n=1 Tax=Salipiger profundus TaxID=1229727 RepID=A0A1U7D039_9RHOB|nr:hypothetical protein Ga0080559_TMP721 [Salipiger profundus]
MARHACRAGYPYGLRSPARTTCRNDAKSNRRSPPSPGAAVFRVSRPARPTAVL